MLNSLHKTFRKFRIPRSRHRKSDVKKWIADGMAAMKEREWGTAERYFVSALEREDQNGRILVQLAHAQKEQGRLADAVKSYRKAVNLLPDDSDPIIHLAYALKNSGEIEDSDGAFSTAVKLTRGDKNLSNELAQIKILLAAKRKSFILKP